MTDSNLLL